MSRHRSDLQPLVELIDNKVNNGVNTISDEEIESLMGWHPKKRYRMIYSWYKRGTSLIASFMNQGHKWRGAFRESLKNGYRLLKRHYDPETKRGFYYIITTEKKHDDYETSNEQMLEIKLQNKYTLTESMDIERERRFVQVKLDEITESIKRKKKKKIEIKEDEQ